MSYCLREKKKEVQRNSSSVRGDKDDNIFIALKYHGFSVGRKGKLMIVCAEEIYTKLYYFLKYIITGCEHPVLF